MSDRLKRTVERFKTRIESGAYYEAHQTIRTIVNRHVKAKQYSEAVDLLYEGANALADKKEYASAGDLVGYILAVYEEAGVTGNDHKQRLIEVINKFPNTEDNTLIDISKEAIKWSKTASGSPFGDSDLHLVFGSKLIQRVQSLNLSKSAEDSYKLFQVAEVNLVLGSHQCLPLYVDFLYQWYVTSDGLNDPGLYLARAVINYAYLKNIKFVLESVNRFVEQLSNAKQPTEIIETEGVVVKFYDNCPLLNFVQLLALTLSRENSSAKFMKLYDEYRQTIEANELTNSIDYLGRLYYDLKLGNANGGNNMFANLMSGLFK